MKRLIIAVDCDDVLVPSTEVIVSMYNRQYSTAVSLKDSHVSDNPEWQASRAEALQRMYDIQLSEEYGLAPPFATAVDSIRRLSEQHELHLVTARPELMTRVTDAMLSHYFPGSFKSLHHIGEGRCKGEVCEYVGADVLIDDNVKHLVAANDYDVRGLIWFGDYPWNKGDATLKTIKRCVDWTSVERELESIASQ